MSEETSTCPRCNTDLEFEQDGQVYTRCIGVEIIGVYDGALFWQCPACGGRWHRWRPGTYQYERAVQYVDAV